MLEGFSFAINGVPSDTASLADYLAAPSSAFINGNIIGISTEAGGTVSFGVAEVRFRSVSFRAAIPEPLTATLIPLALSPLLLRRRRAA